MKLKGEVSDITAAYLLAKFMAETFGLNETRKKEIRAELLNLSHEELKDVLSKMWGYERNSTAS